MLCNGKHYKTYNYVGISVVFCTDLSCKELQVQVDVGMVVTSGSLCGGMVSTLVQAVRDVGLIASLGTIFSIVITPMTLLLVHDPEVFCVPFLQKNLFKES